MSDTPSPDAGQDRNGLPGADAVEATLRMQGATDQDIKTFRRLVDYGHAENLSQAELARLVKVDAGALSKIFNGKYPTGISKIAERVEEQLADILRRKLAAERPLVDTWVFREVGLFCQATRASRGIGILTGRSHTGKTTGLKHYADRTPDTVYMRMRSGGAAGMFAKRLARACGFSDRQAYSELVDRAVGFLNPGKLLIVDEAHQTVVGRRVQTVTLGLIQEIHDESGCSVVLCATPVFREKMLDDRLRLFFEQIDNRGTLPRRLPDLAPMVDINAIIRAYGLPPAPATKLDAKDPHSPLEVVLSIREKNGLGKLVHLLSEARRIAANRREPFTWDTVLNQAATGQSWEQGDGPDEADEDGKGER